jgi:hypothetical protein
MTNSDLTGEKLRLLDDIGEQARKIINSEDGHGELDLFVLSIAQRYEELTHKSSERSK